MEEDGGISEATPGKALHLLLLDRESQLLLCKDILSFL